MSRSVVAAAVASVGLTCGVDLTPAVAQSDIATQRSIWVSMPPGGYGPRRAKVPLGQRIKPDGFGPTFGRPVTPMPLLRRTSRWVRTRMAGYGWYSPADLRRMARQRAVR